MPQSVLFVVLTQNRDGTKRCGAHTAPVNALGGGDGDLAAPPRTCGGRQQDASGRKGSAKGSESGRGITNL